MNNSSALVQYVIIRKDLINVLKWTAGAIIAQACHATAAVVHTFKDDPITVEYLKDLDSMHKIVLEIPDEESIKTLVNQLSENGIKHKLWIEKPENIPTCLVLKPYPKEEVQSYFKKLKLFKV
ncbi:conserved hypothetical protein [Pediculus humanus corporis]|uniref:peptidyl-tRNA hydrolase n=1 Tax=Pediculus humanus subsp. corporis TaxID=121224 RepID=E0VQF6_PEDHC|nr:uncharacterized protein Phum_PHUM376890 [Pediculus humanus corporis]EEB15612.1 conserved hypothetical protein [Pediculus humanus corporis]